MATTIVWLSELATYFSCNSSIQQCMIWLHTSLSTWLCLHHVINWYLWPKDLMLPHISSYIRDAAVVFFFFSKSRRNQNVKFRPEYELVTVFTPQESERQNRFLPSRFHIHLLLFSSITYLKLSMLSPNSPEHEPVHWRVSDQKLQDYHHFRFFDFICQICIRGSECGVSSS